MSPDVIFLLATHAGQAAATLILTALLARLHRSYHHGYLRDWTLSWAALTVFLTGTTAALWMAAAGNALHPARLIASLIASVAGYLQIAWLVLGARGVLGGGALPATRTRMVLAACAVVGIVTALAFAFTPGAALERMLVRIGLRSLVAGVAFAGAAVIVWRADRDRGWLGPRLLSAGLGTYALEHFHYVTVVVVEYVTRGAFARYTAYLGAVDVVINFVIALGMVVWLLERERDRAVELEARAARSDKLESLGQMAGGVAHDFNNLLTGIVANSSLVAEELPQGSRAHQRVLDIHAQAQRAAGLSRQILTYAGRGGRKSEPVDLSALVGEMSQLLSSVISKGAKLQISLAPNLPATLADPDQIRQVVMNLIINASEALEGEPGVISVSTGVVGSMQGREVYVEVADTGTGMSPDVQARMFDPYFTTRTAGRGLGLSTALGIVRSHDGSIRVQSHPGQGTTVRVTLPATSQPALAKPEPAPALGRWRGSGTVLVVDDEPSVRRAAQRVLEVGGFEVVTAGDGVEAIEVFAAARNQIVAVVLDVTMPRLGGRETFQELRRLRPDVPVVVCSGYTQEKTDEWLDGETRAVFLEKPFEPAQLLGALRGLLNGVFPTTSGFSGSGL